MTRYRVEFDGVICREGTGDPVTDHAEVQRFVDRILLELSKIVATDPRVIAQRDTGHITVSVSVEESEVFMASMTGFTQIRTAVHAADLGTPGWKVEWLRTSTDTSPDGRQRPEVMSS